MAKFACAVLLLLALNVGVYFAMGQNTIDDSSTDEQDLDKSCSGASLSLAKSIQSEFQSIKAQIAHLEERVERQGTYTNYSIQQISGQMQRVNTYVNAQIRRLSGYPCPTGFNRTVNGYPKCYAVLSQKTDWNTAQERCRRLHADSHLAVINGTMEQQIVTNIVKNLGCVGFYDHKGSRLRIEYYWIGGQLENISDCRSAYVWRPDNRTSIPLGYRNWARGEPSCSDNIEKCFSMTANGPWNDLACGWSLCSVCEVVSDV